MYSKRFTIGWVNLWCGTEAEESAYAFIKPYVNRSKFVPIGRVYVSLDITWEHKVHLPLRLLEDILQNNLREPEESTRGKPRYRKKITTPRRGGLICGNRVKAKSGGQV